MRILFITATRIGDAVLTSGVLDHVLARYPGHRVTVAAGPVALPLFEAVPRLERLIPIEKRAGGGHWLRLWSRVATCRWDLVVDLRASAISYLLLAGERIVGRRAQPHLHRVEELGKLLGLEIPPAPRVWLNQRHEKAAAELLPDGVPLLALAPAANWRGKQWRAESFAELARRLTAAGGALKGARIMVLAAAQERATLAPLYAALPPERLVDLAGRVDLPTAAACLRRAALFVGNDSGLMHLAAAAGTPTLGLFGPSRAERYAPWGPNCAFVRTPESYDELVGHPGFNHLTTQSLMGNLAVDDVEAAAIQLRRQSGQAGI